MKMISKVIRFLKKHPFSIVATIGILYLSIASPSAFPKAPKVEGLDKIAHILMYAGVAFVLAIEVVKDNRLKYFAWAIMFPIIYGALMELLQYYFPPRTPDVIDFLADITGVLLGFVSARLLLSLRKKQ